MGRTPCCDKANVKKGPWSPGEDAKLKDYIEKHGTGGNWISLPQKSGLKRCGKSCRLRWLNYLRPDIKHGDFSEEEDRLICNLFATIGSRWSVIAAQLPGRTDNDIKNYWNTKLKKKLMSINNNNIIIPPPPSQIKNPPFVHQPSSTNSSSSSSPSSYSYSYSDTNPTWSFSTIDPMISIISPNNNNNNNNNNNLVNPTTPLFFPQETTFNMITSCSSNSDGSGESEVVLVGGQSQPYQEPPLLDYGLEEIKQLISSTGCTKFFFDDETT